MTDYQILKSKLDTMKDRKTTSFVWNIHYIKSDAEIMTDDIGIGPAIICELNNGDRSLDTFIISYSPLLNDVVASRYMKDGGVIRYHTEHVSRLEYVGNAIFDAFSDCLYFIIKNCTIVAECASDLKEFVKNDIMDYLSQNNPDKDSSS